MTLPAAESESKRANQQDTQGVSVIIPAFNEEGGIEATLDAISDCLGTLDRKYEIIVVNDGSTDRTSETLKQRDDIVLVEHSMNRGYGASLKSGVHRSRYPLIAIIDADGTYPVESLPRLIEMMDEADMAVGARVGSEAKHSFLRLIPKWFLTRFAEWVAQSKIPDINSGLRVFRRDVAIRFLPLLPDGFSFTLTITLAMMTNGYAVRYEPISYHVRVGRSKIRPIRDTLRFLALIIRTGIYFAPLRVFMPIAGLFFIGFVVKLGIDIAARNLTDGTILLLVAATQLTMFALLADMIDRRTR